MANWDTVNDLVTRLHEGLADSQQVYFSPDEELAALNEGVLQLFQVVQAEKAKFYFETTPETINVTSASFYYPLVNDFIQVAEIIPTADADKAKAFIRKPQNSPEFRDLFAAPLSDTFGEIDTFYYDVVGDRTLVIVPKTANALSVDVYTIRPPTNMVLGTDPPPVKNLWRPLIVEYAVRKLKGKEETGEYVSHEKLYQFMLENLSKSAAPRSDTNPTCVDEYDPGY